MRELERVVVEQVAAIHVGRLANGGVFVPVGAHTVEDADGQRYHGDQNHEQAHPERDGQDEHHHHRRRILDGAYKTYVHTVETARQQGGGMRPGTYEKSL